MKLKKINGIAVLLAALVVILNACRQNNCEYISEDTFPYDCKKGMDVAFLIDYTGSMGGAIDNIKSNVSTIVSNIITQSGGDYRLALGIFDETEKTFPVNYFSQAPYTSLPAAQKIVNTTGPTTSQYLTIMEPFSATNQLSFNNQLAKLNTFSAPGPMFLGSGSNPPEPGGMLADKIINGLFAGAWRNGKTKLCIIITDAQDGGDDDNATSIDDVFLSNLATQANANQIQFILITNRPSGVLNYETKLIAGNTGGLKLTSANFTNIAPKIDSMINQLCINNKLP